MAITPKDLNQTNSSYGFKQMRHAWEANLSLLSRLQENYNLGAYDRVIRDAVDDIKGMRIRTAADVSKMNEGDLARFYYLGKSYLGMDQIDNAVACFHVVYSQHGFEKKMLTEPMDFAGLVSRAGHELQEIAKERGENYVNGVQPGEFMAREFKGGCFIATAVYGTPIGPELDVFRNFRDETLLSCALGCALVQIYYAFSPPLASLISRSTVCRSVVRRLALEPLRRLIQTPNWRNRE
jgi:hypothetical protein